MGKTLENLVLCVVDGALHARGPAPLCGAARDSAVSAAEQAGKSVRLITLRAPRVFEREMADGIAGAAEEEAVAARRVARAKGRRERKEIAAVQLIAASDGSTDRRGFPLQPLTDDTPQILPSSTGSIVAVLWRRAARYALVEVGTVFRAPSGALAAAGWIVIEEGEFHLCTVPFFGANPAHNLTPPP